MAHKRIISRTTASAPSAESAPTWERVVMDMKAMKPHFADCAEEAAQFASAWSGGDKPLALLEVEVYAKQLKVRKEPEKCQLGFLAGAKLSRAPKWPLACLKALLSAPEQWLSRTGGAKVFSGA